MRTSLHTTAIRGLVLLCIVTVLLLPVLLSTAVDAAPTNWAVLVAGSKGYSNYRHQADICHTFHILTGLGIPESQIIVMMYDDIARSRSNPHPGSIINCYGCPNVYPGVPHDYTGSDVTADNFLRILRGEDMTGTGSGKSLRSGPEDNVFVFYSDHGSPGLVAMPVGSPVHAKDLIETLAHMHKNRMYNSLVFYLEACESGSMFNNLLPNDWNIFATTASNPFVSSYACDYDSSYRAYLNDCWSRNFMNDTVTHRNEIHSTHTLQRQFENVKKATTKSPACLYGDERMGRLPVGHFLAGRKSTETKQSFMARTAAAASSGHRTAGSSESHVDSRHVKTEWLKHRLAQADTAQERVQWTKELQQHQRLKTSLELVWETFARRMQLPPLSIDRPHLPSDKDQCYSKTATIDVYCMKEAVEAAERACGTLHEEELVYAHYLNAACQRGDSPTVMERHLRQICSSVQVDKDQ